MKDLYLSPRQVEVCCLSAAGESDKAIARELGCSVRTVRFHMESAAKRIHAHMPILRATSPRKIIFAYYVEYAGVAAFQKRRAEVKKAA